MVSNDSVICCVMNNKGNFLLVNQFRPNLQQNTLEFPAGGVEHNEKNLDAAHREILEETGYKCDLIYLGSFRLLLNRTTNEEHLYFGLNPVKKNKYKLEEGIKIEEVTRKNFLKLVQSSKYFQLAGIGIIQLASWNLKLDILNESIKNIKKSFYEFQK